MRRKKAQAVKKKRQKRESRDKKQIKKEGQRC